MSNATHCMAFLLRYEGNPIMEHHFNVAIAQKYSMQIAIFLQNIAFWIQHNKANKINFYEGCYWTFNTIEAFTELFPYWTYDQIRKIIKDCIDNKLLIKGNFNKSKYDKTKWYALTEKGLELFPHLICEKTQIEKGEKPDRFEKKPRPIPDKKPKMENSDKTTTVVVVDDSIISKEIDQELISIRNKWDPAEYNLLAEDEEDMDVRSNEEFLYQCKFHLEHCTNPKFHPVQHMAGLKSLIKKGFRVPPGYISPIEERKRKEKERKKRKEQEESSIKKANELAEKMNIEENAKKTRELLLMLKKS